MYRDIRFFHGTIQFCNITGLGGGMRSAECRSSLFLYTFLVSVVKTEAENQLVKLADIITIRPGSGGCSDCQAASRSKSVRSNIELSPIGAATSFSVYHVRRVGGHKLRQGRIVFHTNDAGVVTQWVDRVSDILAWPGDDSSVAD